jgi:hypothetical protein
MRHGETARRPESSRSTHLNAQPARAGTCQLCDAQTSVVSGVLGSADAAIDKASRPGCHKIRWTFGGWGRGLAKGLVIPAEQAGMTGNARPSVELTVFVEVPCQECGGRGFVERVGGGGRRISDRMQQCLPVPVGVSFLRTCPSLSSKRYWQAKRTNGATTILPAAVAR